ncbi:MAG: hypothetical protein OXR73_35430 [Myxococcales bacterium]|nr:hypothetical protein [Myxococcales bacterium]
MRQWRSRTVGNGRGQDTVLLRLALCLGTAWLLACAEKDPSGDQVMVTAPVTGDAPTPGQEMEVAPGAATSEAQMGQAMPGQAMPGQAMPGQAMPGQAMPNQAVPGQATAGQASTAGAQAPDPGMGMAPNSEPPNNREGSDLPTQAPEMPSETPETEDPPANVDDEPMPSEGCTGGTVASGRTVESIEAAGRRREYVLRVPDSYDGSEPFKVLIDFHGGTYNGPRWDSRASNQFPDMAETEHFIYIAPTGLNQWWTTTEGADGADGQFMRSMIDRLKTTACVDTRRIYATGCSMGGDMSFYMACYHSDIIAAVYPMCGSAFFDLEQDCKPTRPISMTFVIGSRDSLNCWDPPRTSVGNPCATEVQSVFQRLNECPGEAMDTHGGLCETNTGCAEGTEVSVCMVDATHTGIYNARDMDIYQETWKFLSRFHIR